MLNKALWLWILILIARQIFKGAYISEFHENKQTIPRNIVWISITFIYIKQIAPTLKQKLPNKIMTIFSYKKQKFQNIHYVYNWMERNYQKLHFVSRKYFPNYRNAISDVFVWKDISLSERMRYRKKRLICILDIWKIKLQRSTQYRWKWRL